MQFCELEGRLYMEKKKGETAATYTKKHKYPRYGYSKGRQSPLELTALTHRALK